MLLSILSTTSLIAVAHYVAFFVIMTSFLWFQNAAKGDGWAASIARGRYTGYLPFVALAAALVLLVLSASGVLW